MRYTLHTRLSMMVEGSGITLALSIIQDLVQKDLQAQSRVKVIDLVWMVQNPGSVPYSLFINDLIDLYFIFIFPFRRHGPIHALIHRTPRIMSDPLHIGTLHPRIRPLAQQQIRQQQKQQRRPMRASRPRTPTSYSPSSHKVCVSASVQAAPVRQNWQAW